MQSGDSALSSGRDPILHTVPPIDRPDAGRDLRHAARGARREPAPGRRTITTWPEPADPPPVREGRRSPEQAERRAFAFDVTAPGVIEGMLIPYGVPIPIGGVFTEVWEPHCLLLNNIRVNVRHNWRRPFGGFGKGLRARDADDAMRVVLTLRDTPEARRARNLVETGALTAFSAEFRIMGEEWPAPDRRIVRQALLTGLALVDRVRHETPLIEEMRTRLQAGETAPFRRELW